MQWPFSCELHWPTDVKFGGKEERGTLFLSAQFAGELVVKDFKDRFYKYRAFALKDCLSRVWFWNSKISGISFIELNGK